MQYKAHLSTQNKSSGTNTCEYIVLHHTATQEGSIQGVLKTLTVSTWDKAVSVHYVVDTNGDVYKIGEDTDILWHAGVSAWQGKTNMNRYSIGIETVWPLKNGGFTDKQRESIKQLLQELCKTHMIDQSRILRHKDVSPGRKIDIVDTFWNWQFATWDAYKESLFAPTEPTTDDIVNAFADKYGIRGRSKILPYSQYETLIILSRILWQK
jgi:N-acetyl-anhydromuramyl-L-alanine amidase AmpD